MTTKTSTMHDMISKEQWFPHPIEKVWKAITENSQVSQWLVPTDFKAEVGFEFTIKDPKEECNMVKGVVREASPYTLIYTWIDQQWQDIHTVVQWDLEEHENGTQVSMKHIGIAEYPGKTASLQFDNFSGGWQRCFSQLETLLNEANG